MRQKQVWPGVMAHTYKSSYLGVKHRRIAAQDQPPQKHKTLSEKQTKNKKDWKHGSSGRVLA
jgi:hypothetical protein